MGIYRTKYKSDSLVDRYKARLVTQGFTQVPELDYSLTFSPVVKASSVWVVLALTTIHHWDLCQLHVKNAFLNDIVTETVHMEQPLGFVNFQAPNHVCRLKKSALRS
ncbi:putative RNA-directed DNA polymerase [Helianthus annuus]|nr:putative RNA-directed DNA polymerase [Helianthus annuus]